MIRAARADDVPAMVLLAEQHRQHYQAYQPVFWRQAANAAESHRRFLERLVANGEAIVLVHKGNGGIDGFVIAQTMPAPPVYDPGGLTCFIDDFCVAGATWEDTGRALLHAATTEAKARGAVQTVVVCGHLDEPKRAMLSGAGYGIASEWYVRTIE